MPTRKMAIAILTSSFCLFDIRAQEFRTGPQAHHFLSRLCFFSSILLCINVCFEGHILHSLLQSTLTLLVNGSFSALLASRSFSLVTTTLVRLVFRLCEVRSNESGACW